MPLDLGLVDGEVFSAAHVDAIELAINAGADSGSYTPTLTNVTLGTGGTPTNTAEYNFVGGILVANGKIKLGTTGEAVSGAITISFPSGFTADSSLETYHRYGHATAHDFGTAVYDLACRSAGSLTAFQLVTMNVSGTYGGFTAISSTVPFTWADGDEIYWNVVVRGSF